MPECELCGETESKLHKCKRCGTMFCEECGSVSDKVCIDCLEEEVDDDEDDDYEEFYYDTEETEISLKPKRWSYSL